MLIPPERGRIFDAKGRIMADNKRILTVAIDWSVIKSRKARDTMFNRLSGPLKVPVIDLQRRYDPCFGEPTIPKCTKGQRYSTLLPLPLKEDVDEDTVTYLKERSEDFPGIQIVEQWKRVYPYAPLASHVVGYLGPITKENASVYKAKNYNTNELVGAFGVEQSMEDTLHGQWGKEVFEVDAAGGIVRELVDQHVDPVAGRDVQLTIDLDVQQYAEQALETKLKQRRNLPTDLTLPDVAAHNPIDPKDPTASGCTRAPPSSATRNGSSTRPRRARSWSRTTPPGRSWPWPAIRGSTTAGWGRSTATSSISCSATRSTRSPARPTPTSPCSSTAPCRASTTWVRRSNRSSPGRRCTAGCSGLRRCTSTRASTSWSRLPDDVCATGVRCEFKNASNIRTNRSSAYGPVTVADALAVSSDAFFYRLGEKFWEMDEHNASIDPTLKGKSTLKDDLERFGFGSESGVQLPFEWSGRIPDDAVKKELVDKHVLAKGEVGRLLVGDNVQVAIGQGLMAATPLQMANGYSTIANGGFLRQPTVVKTIFEPLVPDLSPGMADLSKAVVVPVVRSAHLQRSVGDATRHPRPDHQRAHAGDQRGSRHEPGVRNPKSFYHTTTGEKLFETYPMSALPIAGKTGTAQGANSYPWNDSSAFAAFSLDDSKPYTVFAYLEKSGYGAKAAAPVVKCIFTALAGKTAMDPVLPSDQLDLNSLAAGSTDPTGRHHVHAAGRRRPGLNHGAQHAVAQAGLRSRQHQGQSRLAQPQHRLGACCSPKACCRSSGCSPSTRRRTRSSPIRTSTSPARRSS